MAREWAVNSAIDKASKRCCISSYIWIIMAESTKITGIICLLLIMTHWIVYPVENISYSYQNNILNNIWFIPSLYLHLPTTCAWGFSVKWHWHSLVEVIFSSHDLCWRNVNTRGLRTIYQGLDSEIEYSNTTHQCFIIFLRSEDKDIIIWIYVEAR